MTKADRINFEKTMLAAFDKLIEDPAYGGSVNSLTPNEDWEEVTGEPSNPNLISPERYQELVDAHVMFKDMDADPFLKSAGISAHWPCGRGCYQSADGGFIIWFGEEDQLRIMYDVYFSSINVGDSRDDQSLSGLRVIRKRLNHMAKDIFGGP